MTKNLEDAPTPVDIKALVDRIEMEFNINFNIDYGPFKSLLTLEEQYKNNESLENINHFYDFCHRRALDRSRLDILEHLFKIQKLSPITDKMLEFLVEAKEEVIDFCIFKTNLQFSPEHLLEIKSGLYRDSGLWQKLEKRQLQSHVQLSSNIIAPTSKSNKSNLKI